MNSNKTLEDTFHDFRELIWLFPKKLHHPRARMCNLCRDGHYNSLLKYGTVEHAPCATNYSLTRLKHSPRVAFFSPLGIAVRKLSRISSPSDFNFVQNSDGVMLAGYWNRLNRRSASCGIPDQYR